MLKHLFSTVMASIKKRLAFYLLVCGSLILGSSCAWVIAIYAVTEFGFDEFHANRDSVFRLVYEVRVNDREHKVPVAPGPMAARLVSMDERVLSAVRVYRDTQVVRVEDRVFSEPDVYFVDPEFLDLFSFPVLSGDRDCLKLGTAYIVLTSESAHKYFAEEEPIGRVLSVGDEEVSVCAVVDAKDEMSHMGFDFLLPLAAKGPGPWIERWSANNFFTYIRMSSPEQQDVLQALLDSLVEDELAPSFAASVGETVESFRGRGGKFTYTVQALDSIHLKSNLEVELEQNGNIEILSTLLLLAAAILLVSCLTFVSLMTSRASDRVVEISLRRTLGASRMDLLGQFFLETFSLVFMSLAVSALFSTLWLSLTWSTLRLGAVSEMLKQPGPWLWFLVAVVLLISAAAGYPSLVLSSLRPGPRGTWIHDHHLTRVLRPSLVVLQYASISALMLLALVIVLQMGFIRAVDLGYNPKGVVVVEMPRTDVATKSEVLVQELAQVSGIQGVTTASAIPGRRPRQIYVYPGSSTREEDLVISSIIFVDSEFLEVMQVGVLEGEGFGNLEAEQSTPVLISKMIKDRFDWDLAVGRQVTVAKNEAHVGAVTVDLLLGSLHADRSPVTLVPIRGQPRYILVRSEMLPGEALGAIEVIWRKVLPAQPFLAFSVEDTLKSLYKNEHRLLGTVSVFSVVATVLAWLGLLGLAVHVVMRSRKEIAVRRAFGASRSDILVWLGGSIGKWVVLSLALGLPAGHMLAQQWLASFAYRIEISLGAVLAVGLLVVVVALSAIIREVLKAANVKPGRVLREL